MYYFLPLAAEAKDAADEPERPISGPVHFMNALSCLVAAERAGSRDLCPGQRGAWRLLCSSFLVMTCFLIWDYNWNILPKKNYIGVSRSIQNFLVSWRMFCCSYFFGFWAPMYVTIQPNKYIPDASPKYVES